MSLLLLFWGNNWVPGPFRFEAAQWSGLEPTQSGLSRGIAESVILERTEQFALARIRNPDGALIVPSDVSTLDFEVHDTKTEQQITTGSFTAADVLTGNLKLEGWTLDTIGYNFRALIPVAAFPVANAPKETTTVYRVDIKLVTADPFTARQAFNALATKVYRTT